MGATSYAVRGGLMENLEFLAPLVDDMQLTLFDSAGASNIPTLSEARALRRRSRELDISISAHLPTAIDLGSADASVRRTSAEIFRRAVDAAQECGADIFVMHASIVPVPDSYAAAHAERVIGELVRLMPMFDSPRRLAIENVVPTFDIETALIDELDTSVCIDVGHHALYGTDAAAHIERWAHRCIAAHIHAVDEQGHDHASLATMSCRELRAAVDGFLKAGYTGPMTMEVFERDDFDGSLAALCRAFG